MTMASSSHNGTHTSHMNPPLAGSASDLPPHSDNVEEELRRVTMALEAVFSVGSATGADPGPGGGADPQAEALRSSRSAADRYLTSFQSHAIAWAVCDQLLSPSPTTNDASIVGQRHFFAAQTLHRKCRTDVCRQLPPDQLPQLRDSLVSHLSRYATLKDASRALVTRLAMAVAALAVQMRWTTLVPDVLGSMLRPHPELAPVVLELIGALPEECASDRLLLVDENFRYEFRDRLTDDSKTVLDFFTEYRTMILSNNNSSNANPESTSRMLEMLYHALHTWMRFVHIPQPLLVASPLIESSFAALSEPSLFEVAVDVIVEVVRMYPSIHAVNTELVLKMIPLVMAIGSSPGDGKQKSPFDQALEDEDEDSLRGFCRIFTEMGESYMSLILGERDMNQQALVELVLRCSAIPEPEVASITLHFWYRFVTCLESIEPWEFRQHIVDYYSPILVRLLGVCTSLMRYPPDIESLKEDMVDDIHRDRFYVADTVEDSCRLLGGHVVLTNIGSRLKEECERVSRLPPDQQLTDWQGMEACLFALHSLAQYVPADENKVLPFVMNLIPQLPPSVPMLRYTASLTVGKYAAWVNSHPEQMQPLMPYLAQGLGIPKSATAAAIAIKDLCECSGSRMSLGDPVLQLYQEIIMAQEQHAQQQQQNGGAPDVVFSLDLRDELQILEGVCKAVSRQLGGDGATSEQATAYLNKIVQPIGARLASYVSVESNVSPRQIMAEVERLTVIVQFLKLPSRPSANSQTMVNPTMEIITQSWSLLDAISQRYPRDVSLAEKICRLHKHALRGCGATTYAPMLDSLISQLVRNFQQSHLSPYLYAGSICITEFGRNPAYTPRLYEMVAAMATASFTLLQSFVDFTAHPDVVEELFYLMARMVSYCPEPVIRSALLPSLLRCSVVGMQLDHKDANRGTMNFIEGIISYGMGLDGQGNSSNGNDPSVPQSAEARKEVKASLESAIVAEGQALVVNLARALMGDLPTYCVDKGNGSIAGILWKLNSLCPDLLLQWIQPAVNAAPETPRNEFLRSIASRVPREEFNLSVRAFLSACDRNRKLMGGVHP